MNVKQTQTSSMSYTEITEEAYNVLTESFTGDMNEENTELARFHTFYHLGMKIRSVENWTSYTCQYYVMDINA
jgi:hypothetical protein